LEQLLDELQCLAVQTGLARVRRRELELDQIADQLVDQDQARRSVLEDFAEDRVARRLPAFIATGDQFEDVLAGLPGDFAPERLDDVAVLLDEAIRAGV